MIRTVSQRDLVGRSTLYKLQPNSPHRCMTHIAMFELGKRSLTLPPATLRKAALQKPVRNRKIR